MPIQADDPTVVPAQAEKVFGQWWMSELHILAPDSNGEASVSATFEKFRRGDDGVGEFANIRSTYSNDALFALAASSPDIAALVDQVTNAVGALAKTAGVLTPPPPPPPAEEAVPEPSPTPLEPAPPADATAAPSQG